MEQRLLSYKNSVISYFIYGKGAGKVVCFHGYGEDGSSFGFLSKHLGDRFTFYVIDLPFHGKTQWNEGLLFTIKDLQQIIDSVVLDQNPKFTLLGFSLGGRVALSLLQETPGNIEKLVLLAPDGLKVNRWYWLATQTWAGNALFRFTMKKPGWFFGLLKFMNRLGFVNTSIFKFVNFYIGDKEARRLLYQRWTGLRKLKPNLSQIQSFINERKIPVRLVYGRHDRIILSSVGERFKGSIKEDCLLKVIESGHQVLHEKYVGEIGEALER